MLYEKRQEIIDYVKQHLPFLKQNEQALDIYDGNLRPYIDDILKKSLSDNYYNAIRDRILPINILQRYVNKVSTTYSKPPQRECENEANKPFLEYYEDAFDINNSMMVADTYSNMFKGFALEPFINNKNKPELRVLSFDKFLVMSDSKSNPEEETVFIKIMGCKSDKIDETLLHVYTKDEFDAFYMNGADAPEYLLENGGVNLYGVIPFIYGKRQKHKLIPTLDSDMLSISKAISVMLSDAAGAQMFQCFSILYGIDVNVENLSMNPNAFWSFKSDDEKKPSVGSIKPEADTQKVMEFVTNIFVLWLETKGIRVGSMGNTQGTSTASGISKIIDEMDAYEVKKKSMQWFQLDEEELWNEKLPAIHNFWIKSGMLVDSEAPSLVVGEMDIEVEFEQPQPFISRTEELANVKAEMDMGILTKEMAIKILHPDYSEDIVSELVEGKREVDGEEGEVLPMSTDVNMGGVMATGDVQKTALNGAQVTSMLEIVQNVASGTIPRDAGLNVLVAAFQIPMDQAEEILASAGTNSFKPKEAAPSFSKGFK